MPQVSKQQPASTFLLGLQRIPLLRFHRIGHLTLRSLKALESLQKRDQERDSVKYENGPVDQIGWPVFHWAAATNSVAMIRPLLNNTNGNNLQYTTQFLPTYGTPCHKTFRPNNILVS